MSIKLIVYGNENTTNLHSLLMGLDLPDQHPIEAIIGLRKELDMKYIKPADGIPASDLAEKYISMDDLQNLDDKTQAMYTKCQQDIISNTALISNNTENISNNTESIFNINTEIGNLKSKFSDLPEITDFYGSSCISQVDFDATDDNKSIDITIIDTDLKVIQPTILKENGDIAVQGTDYSINYKDDTTLNIIFNENGKYRINYISGEITDSQYDILYNYIKKLEEKYIKYNSGTFIQPEHNVAIEYDEQGKIIKETYTGNINKIVEYAYDTNDNIISKTVTQDDIIKTANYKYDDNGKLIQIEDTGTDIPLDGTKAPPYTLVIEYDDNGFVSKETYTGSINKTIVYTNNPYGDVITKTVLEDGIEKTARYIYDQDRKLIQIIDEGTEKVAVVFTGTNLEEVSGGSTETASDDVITKEDIDLIFSTIFKEVI